MLLKTSIFMCDGWGVAQNYHNYSAIIRGNTLTMTK